MKTTHQSFLETIATLRTVPFNPEWNNGTGYLDRAATDNSLNLKKGEMVQSISVDEKIADLNNRRILLIGTGNGDNVVVFERFTGGIQGVIVSNTPRSLKDFESKTESHTSFKPNTLELIIAEINNLND